MQRFYDNRKIPDPLLVRLKILTLCQTLQQTKFVTRKPNMKHSHHKRPAEAWNRQTFQHLHAYPPYIR